MFGRHVVEKWWPGGLSPENSFEATPSRTVVPKLLKIFHRRSPAT